MTELVGSETVADTSVACVLAEKRRRRGAYIHTSARRVVSVVSVGTGQLAMVEERVEIVVRVAV